MVGLTPTRGLSSDSSFVFLKKSRSDTHFLALSAINVAFLRLRCAAPLRREWPDSLLSSGFPDMFEVSNEGNREVLLLAKQ